MGAEGAQALNDINQYVAGINAFINLTQLRSGALPAEYPALGIVPPPWTLADSAAVGVYLIGQFTVFGGQQGQQARRCGWPISAVGPAQAALPSIDDLRLADDPARWSRFPRRFPSDSTGRVNPRSEAMIDPGLAGRRDTRDRRPVRAAARHTARGRHAARRGRGARPRGLHLPHHASNAVLVDAPRSGTGRRWR